MDPHKHTTAAVVAARAGRRRSPRHTNRRRAESPESSLSPCTVRSRPSRGRRRSSGHSPSPFGGISTAGAPSASAAIAFSFGPKAQIPLNRNIGSRSIPTNAKHRDSSSTSHTSAESRKVDGMPQPRLKRRRLSQLPDPAPIIYDVDMLAEPCSPEFDPFSILRGTPFSRFLAWFVWVADLLFIMNLIPGDTFRRFIPGSALVY